MEQLNDSLIFTIHIILFAVKLWLIISVISEIKITKGKISTMKMVVFTMSHVLLLILAIIIAGFEFWFLSNFYNTVHLDLYEGLVIVDQIIVTTFLVQIMKGGNK